MIAYALNLMWYKARPDRVTPIHDDKVKVGFFRCIDKMYHLNTTNTICTKWTKLATTRVFFDVAKMDIRTMT